MEQNVENVIKGFKQAPPPQPQVDELWGNQKPDIQFAQFHGKEKSWFHRDPNFSSISNRRINYLKLFTTADRTIHDGRITEILNNLKSQFSQQIQNNIYNPYFEVEDLYRIDKESTDGLTEIRNRIRQTANYKILPNLGMALSFDVRYKNDFVGIWAEYVKQVDLNLHHYSLEDLTKIRYATAGTLPKAGLPEFHQQVTDLLLADLKHATISQLLHITHAYRLSKQIKILKSFYDQILVRVNNQNNTSNTGKKATEVNQKTDPSTATTDNSTNNLTKIKKTVKLTPQQLLHPDDYANIFYTYIDSRPQQEYRKSFRIVKEVVKVQDAKFLDSIFQPLMDNVPQMSLDALQRLAVALNLSRLVQYGDLATRIQGTLLKRRSENLDKQFDEFHSSHFTYSFAQMQNGRGFYNSTLFKDFLYPKTLSHWSKYSNLQRARVLYSFSKNSLPHEHLMPFTEQNIDTLNFAELHYLAQALMFNKVTDQSIWSRFIKNVCLSFSERKLVISQHYYLSLKIARYYISSLFPNFDLQPYDAACQVPEFSFSTIRMRDGYINKESEEIMGVIFRDLKVEAKAFLEWENLFIIDAAILPQQVGIMVQKSFYDSLESDGRTPSPMFQLKKFILENHGWKIVVVNYQDFLDMKEGRKEWLKAQIDKAFQEQSQVYNSQEKERYEELLVQMLQVGQDTNIQNPNGEEMMTEKLNVFDFGGETQSIGDKSAAQGQQAKQKASAPPAAAAAASQNPKQ